MSERVEGQDAEPSSHHDGYESVGSSVDSEDDFDDSQYGTMASSRTFVCPIKELLLLPLSLFAREPRELRRGFMVAPPRCGGVSDCFV